MDRLGRLWRWFWPPTPCDVRANRINEIERRTRRIEQQSERLSHRARLELRSLEQRAWYEDDHGV